MDLKPWMIDCNFTQTRVPSNVATQFVDINVVQNRSRRSTGAPAFLPFMFWSTVYWLKITENNLIKCCQAIDIAGRTSYWCSVFNESAKPVNWEKPLNQPSRMSLTTNNPYTSSCAPSLGSVPPPQLTHIIVLVFK